MRVSRELCERVWQADDCGYWPEEEDILALVRLAEAVLDLAGPTGAITHPSIRELIDVTGADLVEPAGPKETRET